ncbi:MAG: DUF3467 domain-containing protein [Anaerolineae bacterium]
MTSQDMPRPVQVNIELPADLEAVYANFALISHSPSEVIIDFARLMPNVPKAKIYARIVMTPMNVKLLHRALSDNIEKFEAKYGEIKVADTSFESSKPMGFKQG